MTFNIFKDGGETFYIPRTFNSRETYTNKEIEMKIVENYIKVFTGYRPNI